MLCLFRNYKLMKTKKELQECEICRCDKVLTKSIVKELTKNGWEEIEVMACNNCIKEECLLEYKEKVEKKVA